MSTRLAFDRKLNFQRYFLLMKELLGGVYMKSLTPLRLISVWSWGCFTWPWYEHSFLIKSLPVFSYNCTCLHDGDAKSYKIQTRMNSCGTKVVRVSGKHPFSCKRIVDPKRNRLTSNPQSDKQGERHHVKTRLIKHNLRVLFPNSPTIRGKTQLWHSISLFSTSPLRTFTSLFQGLSIAWQLSGRSDGAELH